MRVGVLWSAVGAAVGAAVTVGGSLRVIPALGRFRMVTSMRARLRPDTASSVATWGAAVRTAIDVHLRPLLLRVTGAPDMTDDRRVLALLETVTRSLRAGSSLRSAVETASAASSDVADRAMSEALRSGRVLIDAVEDWMADRRPARVLVGTSLQLAARSGGAVAPVLDGVADSLRDRLLLTREVTALSSQARASAAVLIIAPIGFALLMAMMDPRVARTQFASPLGWICTAGGLVLDLIGAVWMSRMIGRVR